LALVVNGPLRAHAVESCTVRPGAGRVVVLAAAEGRANAGIARRLGICVDAVRKWRARFCAEGPSGLADCPRPGRRRIFWATATAEVKALACALPAEAGAASPVECRGAGR
jgi:transposase-like protein